MKVRINVEMLPLHFVILGVFLVLFNSFELYAMGFSWFSAILLFIGIIMSTTQQQVLINTGSKKFEQFYWVLGMKLSNYSVEYSEIVDVYYVDAKYSQQYGKYNRWFISGVLYKGFIKLRDHDNIYIGKSKSIAGISRRLNKIAKKLNVEVIDRTESGKTQE